MMRDKIEKSCLPFSWTSTRLSELIEIVRGVTYRKSQSSNVPVDGYLPVIRANNIQNDKLILRDFVYVDSNLIKPTQKIKKNDVLVAMSSGSKAVVGKTAKSTSDLEAAFGAFCGLLRPIKHIHPEIISYFTRSSYYRNKVSELSAGANINNLKPIHFNELEFPLPPLAEQKVIADKLDTLLAQVETTKTGLERIPEILKTFRQSVLAAAVSGKLVDKSQGHEKHNWSEEKLDEITDNIVDCPHSTPKWSEDGKYCVRTTAFNPFYLDLSNQGVVSEDVYQDRIKRLKPLGGDILYSREGTVGVACQIPQGVELCLGQRMVLIRAGSRVLPEYLTIVLNSEKILSIVKEKTIGSTAPRVNMKDIRSYPIPLPPIEKQKEIVRRVEQLFTFADSIEQKANASLARVNNLTQSILVKAFRGELTTDWRTANPELISGENSAELLLEKVRAEREAKVAKKKPKRKPSKKQ